MVVLKKNLLFLLGVVGGLLYACSVDENAEQIEPENTQEVTATHSVKSKDFVVRTDTIHLFEVTSAADIERNIGILSQVDAEIESLVDGYKFIKEKNDPEVDLITYKLNYKNNKVYVTDLVFWNTDLKIPVDKIIPYVGRPVYDFDEAFNCPEGWSGGQSYGSQESINQAAQNIMSKAFLQGDCVEIRYVKGFFNVKLCHRKC